MSNDCFDMYDWENHVRDKCLTIDDIINLKSGDELVLLALDRNVFDIACSNNKEGKKYSAKKFFRCNKALYKHDKDLKGVLILYYGDDDIDLDDFEFHIEWKKDNWYPLKDGMLPEKDPQGFSKFPKDMKLNWKEYPGSTRIGYRGSMIKWKLIDSLPKIHFKYD